MPNLDAVKQELLRTNDDYRRLTAEHRECEERLSQMVHNALPSQEDEAEEKRLKIHKLALKDRMEAMVREHRVAV